MLYFELYVVYLVSIYILTKAPEIPRWSLHFRRQENRIGFMFIHLKILLEFKSNINPFSIIRHHYPLKSLTMSSRL